MAELKSRNSRGAFPRQISNCDTATRPTGAAIAAIAVIPWCNRLLVVSGYAWRADPQRQYNQPELLSSKVDHCPY
jgi:hypothetical protein